MQLSTNCMDLSLDRPISMLKSTRALMLNPKLLLVDQASA